MITLVVDSSIGEWRLGVVCYGERKEASLEAMLLVAPRSIGEEAKDV